MCSDGNRVVAAFACVESPNVTGVQLMDETAGIPPWDTADNTGAWMSDHNTPTAVAVAVTDVNKQRVVKLRRDRRPAP